MVSTPDGPVPIKEFASGIARLRLMGGDSADTANDLLDKYGREIDPAILAQYGIEAPGDGGSESFLGRAKRLSTGALGVAADILDRPSQAALQTLDFVTSGFKDTEGLAGSYADVARLVPGIALTEKVAGFDGLGYDAEDRISFTNAALLGDAVHDPSRDRGPKLEGRWFDLSPAGAADLIGSIATDPTNFVTAGTRPLAKVGLDTLRTELGQEAAERFARQGLKGLTEVEQSTLRTAIAASPAAAAARPRLNTAEKLGRAVGLRGGADYTEQVIENLARSGRGGIRVAGFTVADSGQLTQARTVAGFGPDGALATATAPLRNTLRQTFIPRGNITRNLGADVAAQVQDLGAQRNALVAVSKEDVLARLEAVSKGGRITPEIKTRMLEALDIGGDVQATLRAFRAEGLEAEAKLLDELATVGKETTEQNVAAGFLRPNEDIETVRAAGQSEAAAKITAEAGQRVTKSEKLVRKARQAARTADEKVQEMQQAFEESLPGAGRAKTFEEGRKIGAATRRAKELDEQAQALERAVKRADDAAPGVREAALREATQAVEAEVGAARKSADELAALADDAEADVAEFASKLETKAADGARITEAQVRKLGKLEGRATTLRRQADRAAGKADQALARGKRTELKAAKTLDPVMLRREGKSIPANDKLVSAAVAARAKADAALDEAEELARTFDVAASTDRGSLSFRQGQRLGMAETAARMAESQARRAERALGREQARAAEALNLVKNQTKIARAGEEAIKRAAAIKPFAVRADDYVMRRANPEALKALKGNTTPLAQQLSRQFSTGATEALTQGGTLKSRRMFEELSTIEANKQITEKFGIENFFETDPVALVSRKHILARAAEAEMRYIKGLSEVMDSNGVPIVLTGDLGVEAAETLGYVKVTGKLYDGVYAHPDIAREMQRMQAVVTNDEAITQWGRFLDRWGGLWATYATVPMLFGVGFFARNTMGNLFNNFLAGVRTTAYKRAADMELAFHQAVKASGRAAGPEFEAALRDILDEDSVGLLLGARRNGVLTEGFVSTDLTDDYLDQASGLGRGVYGKLKAGDKRGALEEFNITRRENALTNPGIRLNKMIENNNRLAHYLSKMDELGDEALAAQSVRKYLFDYSDLTAFERTKIRTAVRFYTYMRKNTPLMFAELAMQPGKFTTLQHIQEATGEGDIQGPLPQYMLNAGAVPRGESLFAIDTPFSSAMETVQPWLKLAAYMPGTREFMPESLRPEEGFSEVAREFLNVPSGGPVEALKFLAQESMREELFSGRPIKDQSASAVADRLTGSLIPLWTKGMSTVGKLTDEDKRRAAIITALTGLRVLEVTPEVQLSEQYRQLDLLNQALEQAKADGLDVPTIQELRDAGIIPEAPRTTRAPRRTPAQRRDEALASLRSAGVEVPAAP